MTDTSKIPPVDVGELRRVVDWLKSPPGSPGINADIIVESPRILLAVVELWLELTELLVPLDDDERSREDWDRLNALWDELDRICGVKDGEA